MLYTEQLKIHAKMTNNELEEKFKKFQLSLHEGVEFARIEERDQAAMMTEIVKRNLNFLAWQDDATKLMKS